MGENEMRRSEHRQIIENRPTPATGWSRGDAVIAGIYLLGVLILLIPLIIAYWPWTSILLSLIGTGVVGVRGFMAWEHHRVSIDERKNRVRAGLFHETDQGFGTVAEDNTVTGYSHGMSGMMPPFSPDLLGMGEEPRSKASYPHTFNEMMKGGYIAPGADFVPAFDRETGEPIRMPSLTSLGISGVQGMGKTVTTELLMMEGIAKFNGRVRFLVVDPHMGVDGEESLLSKIEPLEPYFLNIAMVEDTVPMEDRDYRNLLRKHYGVPPVTDGYEDTGAWMEVVAMEMDRRKHGKVGDVWVIVIDEFAAIMDGPNAKAISSAITKINNEARKMGMFALLVSQEWKGNATGGTNLRHAIASFLIHNTPAQVVSLFAPSEVAREAERLDIGEVIVRTRGKATTGQVPLVTAQDAEALMRLYPTATPRRRVSEEHNEGRDTEQTLLGPVPVDGQYVELPGGSGPAVMGGERLLEQFSGEELDQVRNLWREGMDVPNIAKRVYGVRSGPELAEAKIKVDRILRGQ